MKVHKDFLSQRYLHIWLSLLSRTIGILLHIIVVGLLVLRNTTVDNLVHTVPGQLRILRLSIVV